MATESTYKAWVVPVDLADLHNRSFDEFLNLLADGVNNALLMNIEYYLVGVREHNVLMVYVCGDDSERDPAKGESQAIQAPVWANSRQAIIWWVEYSRRNPAYATHE